MIRQKTINSVTDVSCPNVNSRSRYEFSVQVLHFNIGVLIQQKFHSVVLYHNV